MLPASFPRTGLVAHRGLAARYPENTIAGLSAALASGTRMLEYDIQVSADGVPMVIHDETLARTCGMPGTVGDHGAAALGAMPCNEAQRFEGAFSGVLMSTHDEVVAALSAHPSACLLAEVKRESLLRFGLAKCMVPVMRTLEPVRDRVVLISFAPEAVAWALACGFAAGWCMDTHDRNALEQALLLQPDLLLTDQLSLQGAEDLWAGPWRWASWEVVAVERARALFEMGVDYVETMSCDTLAAAPELSDWINADGP